MRVFGDGEAVPSAAQCVVGLQCSVGGRAGAQQHVQRGGGLHGADDTDQRSEHAEEGTGAVVVGFAVEEAGVAGVVGQVGALDGELAVEAHGRAGDEGFFVAHAGAVDGLAGGEVVAAVEHDVGLCGLFGQFVFIEKAGQARTVQRLLMLFSRSARAWALLRPMSASPKAVCRCRLVSSTVSPSAMFRRPMPAAAR